MTDRLLCRRAARRLGAVVPACVLALASTGVLAQGAWPENTPEGAMSATTSPTTTAPTTTAPTYLLPVVEYFRDRQYSIGLVRTGASGGAAWVGAVAPDRRIRGHGPWFVVGDRTVSGSTVSHSVPKRLVYTHDRVAQVVDLTDRGVMPVPRPLGNGRPICQMNRVVQVSPLAGGAWLEGHPYWDDTEPWTSCDTSQTLYLPLNAGSTTPAITFPAGFHLVEPVVAGNGSLLGYLGHDGTVLRWLAPDRRTFRPVTGANTLPYAQPLASLPDGRTRLYTSNRQVFRLTVTDTTVSMAALNVSAPYETPMLNDATEFFWTVGQSLVKAGRTGAYSVLSVPMYNAELVVTPAGPVRLGGTQLELVHKATGVRSTVDLHPLQCSRTDGLGWSGQHVYFLCGSYTGPGGTFRRATVGSAGIVLDPSWSRAVPATWQYQYSGQVTNGSPRVEKLLTMAESQDTLGHAWADAGRYTQVDLASGVATVLGTAYQSYDLWFEPSAYASSFAGRSVGWTTPVLRVPFTPNSGPREERLFGYLPGTASSLRLIRRSATD
ncbi:hypothetical protein [Ideonella sp.]|uniref:hypothetical protein n=1 Tax=Ideonella sp. TaxID=1929293 RepID=UPI0035AE654C